MGIIEDAIALYFSVGFSVNLQSLIIIAFIAIPFSFIGEVLVDRIDFIEICKRKGIIRVKNALLRAFFLI
jgi:hypothetical protein